MEETSHQLKLKEEKTEENESLLTKWRNLGAPYKPVLLVLASLKVVLSLAILIEITLTFFLILIFSEEQLFILILVFGSMVVLILVVDFGFAMYILLGSRVSYQERRLYSYVYGIYYKYTSYIFGSLLFSTIMGCVITYLAGISFFSDSPPHILSELLFSISTFGLIILYFWSIEWYLYVTVWEHYLALAEEFVKT